MRTIILIVTLFVSLPAISQKKLPNVIEKLTYRGYYNWSFIWINAGSVEMTVQPSDKYPNAQCIFCRGVFESFVGLGVQAERYVDIAS